MGKLSILIIMLLFCSITVKSMSLDIQQQFEHMRDLADKVLRDNDDSNNNNNNNNNEDPPVEGTGNVQPSQKSPENSNSGSAGNSEGEGTRVEVTETRVDRKKGLNMPVKDSIVSRSISKRANSLPGECPTPATSSNNPCKNYGTCVSSQGGHTCLCKAGWKGDDCSEDNGSTEDPNTLFVNNGVTIWGTWDSKKSCPKSHYVTGFQMLFLGDQGGGDDSGVNKLSLLCSPPDGSANPKTYITSGVINWGDWTSLQTCPFDYYVVDFNQQVDPDSGGGSDDWGTANFKFTCRGPGLRGTQTQEIIGNAGGSGWGNWGEPKSATCRPGTAVCAMQCRNVAYQGAAVWNDDVSMVDTRLWCCNFDDQPSRYVITNIKFQIDEGKLVSQPPKVVATATLRNEEYAEQTQTPTLTYEKSTTNEWTKTIGLSVGVSTEINVGGEASVVSASFGVTVETSYETSWGTAKSESLAFSTAIGVKVPARSISVVEMMLTEAIMDIPYIADLTTTFVGTTKTDVRKISGVWKGVRAIKSYGVVKPSIPI